MVGLLSGVASRRHADHRYDHSVQAHIMEGSVTFFVLPHLSRDQCQLRPQETFSSAVRGISELAWYFHSGVSGHRRVHPCDPEGGRGEMAMAIRRRPGIRW